MLGTPTVRPIGTGVLSRLVPFLCCQTTLAVVRSIPATSPQDGAWHGRPMGDMNGCMITA